MLILVSISTQSIKSEFHVRWEGEVSSNAFAQIKSEYRSFFLIPLT